MVVGQGNAFHGALLQNLRVGRGTHEVIGFEDLVQVPVRQHALQVGHGQVVRPGQGQQVPEGPGVPVPLDGPDKAPVGGAGFLLAAQGAVPEEGDGDGAGILLHQVAHLFRHGIRRKGQPFAGSPGGRNRRQHQCQQQDRDPSPFSVHAHPILSCLSDYISFSR